MSRCWPRFLGHIAERQPHQLCRVIGVPEQHGVAPAMRVDGAYLLLEIKPFVEAPGQLAAGGEGRLTLLSATMSAKRDQRAGESSCGGVTALDMMAVRKRGQKSNF